MKTSNTRILFLSGVLSSLLSAAAFAVPAQVRPSAALKKSNVDEKIRSQLAPEVADAPEHDDDNESIEPLDTKVVNAFVNDDCKTLLELVPESKYTSVSGRALSLAATCNPPGKDPDKMFSHARELSPDDDSILLLQARYRSQKAMINADELWTLLLSRTHDEKVKQMASLYLNGDNAEADAILMNKKTQVSGFLQFGALQENNPTLVADSDPNESDFQKSSGETTSGLIKIAKPTKSGTLGVDYFFSQTSYAKSHEADIFAQELGFPLVIGATREAVITARPYVTHSMLRSVGYSSDLGVSLTRIDPLDGLNQTAGVTFFTEHYFQSEDQPQQGTHFRFDYGLHPRNFSIIDFDVLAYVDHSSAGRDDSYSTQSIPYSHFTYGGLFSMATKGFFIFGLNTNLTYRVDDDRSTFLDATSGQPISKTREDVSIQVQPYFSLAFGAHKQWEAMAAFQWSRNKSNIGATDYLDRNSSNSTTTLSIKRYFEN